MGRRNFYKTIPLSSFLRKTGETCRFIQYEIVVVTSLFEHCRAVKHLLEILKPYNKENGGPIRVDHVTYVEGRGNLILEYSPEGAEGTVTFLGSHLDVVPANPETWERNPFKLAVEVCLAIQSISSYYCHNGWYFLRACFHVTVCDTI